MSKNSPGLETTRFQSRRKRILGFDPENLLRVFFGGNAVVAIIILVLITVFLAREGLGFFPQNHESLKLYRQSGVEYVDLLQERADKFARLQRYLEDVRRDALTQKINEATENGQSEQEAFRTATMELAPLNQFIMDFEESFFDYEDFLIEVRTEAIDLRQRYSTAQDNTRLRENLERQGKLEEAAQVQVEEVNLTLEVEPILATVPQAIEHANSLRTQIEAALLQLPAVDNTQMERRLERFAGAAREFLSTFPETRERLEAWDPAQPVAFSHAFTSFFLGTEWTTNSFVQDWYGIIPLLTGSLLVSLIALLIAVPFGVAGAIYVNQIASPREQKVIKPYIEFVAAIPSVVIGFFGVAVFGETVRQLSQWELLAWVPFFPLSERLNAFTAGCLLALMAIPTIFTLAEDALNNVPRAFKEASFAVGATRLQTTLNIILPSALSGIISAILLGFGRVIGETMVVLLCAGNRIAIPDFTEGLGIFFQPVHTMTGIIAQELGEVVRGSLHYRSLFLVGIVLFLVSLLINYLAQRVLRRYRLLPN